ncbi:MAG: hypothetical protein K2K15_02630, partial [Anaeroplasmataceae bacterium]|nr:hypothetical protein [Anaeroplasmataceae bacterium]
INDSSSFAYSLYHFYIEKALKIGGIPILCTPIVRADAGNCYTNASGHITPNGNYAKVITDLGRSLGIEVIPLTDLTRQKYEQIGYEEAIYYHAIALGKKYEEKLIPDMNSLDTTHLNQYGAKFVAYLVAKTIQGTKHPLAEYVLKNIEEPVKDKDLVSNPEYVFLEYKAPNVGNYHPIDSYQTISKNWYGTAFGDCGENPSINPTFVAKELKEGVFLVGQDSLAPRGKLALNGDGLAFLFQAIQKNQNFELSAKGRILSTVQIVQAGFGLMLRDDCYIEQTTNKAIIASNYLTAGVLRATDQDNALFYREGGVLKKGLEYFPRAIHEGDTFEFRIHRLGQAIETSIVLDGRLYKNTTYDFDLFAVDQEYMYVGMFATRGTIIEFKDVNLKLTGSSQGA